MERVKALLAGAKRSRTVWFGVLVAVLGTLEAMRPDVQKAIDVYLPEELRVLVWPVIGVAIVVLRTLTTQPLSQR